MKILRIAAVLSVVALCFAGKAWGATCPTTASTNTDCGFILTIAPGGVFTGAPVAGANPYDGSDDALVGVINNSGVVFSGSITLTGSGNGGGLFGFDGDGICSFVFTGNGYCSVPGAAPTGYEGPNNTFSGINASETTGTVNFFNIPIGYMNFFS